MAKNKVKRGVNSMGNALGNTFSVATKGLRKSGKLIGLNAMSKEKKRGKVVKGAVLGGLIGLAVGMQTYYKLLGAVEGEVSYPSYEDQKNKKR